MEHDQDSRAVRAFSPDVLGRFFGLATDLFCIADLSGRFLRVNQVWIKVLGWEERDLVSQPFMNFVHPDDVAATAAEMVKLGNGQDAVLFENRYRHRDGSYRWLEWCTRAAEPGDTVLYAVARDVTRRKEMEGQLEEKQAELRERASLLSGFYGSTPLMMGVVEIEGEDIRHVFDNKATTDFFEVAPGGTAGRLASGLGVPVEARRDWIREYRLCRATGGPVRFESRQGGRWLDITVSPIEAAPGRPHRYAYVVQDLTERKAMEEELSRAKEAAVQASEVKSRFLATMSHEIRTPLNGILGMVSALEQTRLEAEPARFVRTLRSCGSALLAQVNDILDFAKIESGAMELETVEFELHDRIEEVLDRYRLDAERRGLRFVATLGPGMRRKVTGDSHRIVQVLINLLGNAFKFTSAGGIDVQADLDTGSPDGYELTVRIADTGIGIPTDGLDKLFQPFSQSDAGMSRRFGGTGLGLAICKQLVELMGGRISATSRLGQGSIFSFSCPLGKAIGGPASRRSQEGWTAVVLPVLSGRRILVVEDDEVNQEVARIFLGRHGCDVDFAATGPEALERFEGSAYSLVFMDCQLPGMDGFETTRRIRAKESGGRRIPILAMTANAIRGDRERCLDAGMDDYLSKPLDPDRLAEVLTRWI